MPQDYKGRVFGIAKPRGEAWAIVSRDPSNATHEYVHHLQAAMPEVDRLFQILFHLHRLPGEEPVDLDKLVRRDPEMLDLALGLLFHHDPA